MAPWSMTPIIISHDLPSTYGNIKNHLIVNVVAINTPIVKSKCIARTTPKKIIAKCNAK
tara:strand:- start:265 stop:441 length:177 start_codon:yes stop_codon:yes gene_type:complete